MKRVLITGATGLIGKDAIQPLLEAGFEIFALTVKDVKSVKNVNWIKADIFDFEKIKEVFNLIKPEYLLHFAWIASGDYLTSEDNYKFLDASLNMLKAFKENGGKRAVYAGTCFEYEFKASPLKESDNLNPTTLYAKCKNELREGAEKYSKENNLSFGWGRIFYVYGKNENEKRLTANIINSLKNNKPVIINNGDLIKDYMYTKDIAAAFVNFLDTKVHGCVNICTGNGISLRDYSTKIAQKMSKEAFLIVKQEPTTQPKYIVGDNSRLKDEVGFIPKYILEEALDEILEKD